MLYRLSVHTRLLDLCNELPLSLAPEMQDLLVTLRPFNFLASDNGDGRANLEVPWH